METGEPPALRVTWRIMGLSKKGSLKGSFKGSYKGYYKDSIGVLGVLRGSWDLVSKVISALIGVIST